MAESVTKCFPIPRMSWCVYQFMVYLSNVKPKIWRLIQVPSDSTFYELHCVIQRVMMWQGIHRHAFYKLKDGKVGQVYIGKHFNYVLDDPVDLFVDEDEALIEDYFEDYGDSFRYTYSLTNPWNHIIVLDEIFPGNPETLYPICFAGEYAGPPEESNPKDFQPYDWPYNFKLFEPREALDRRRIWHDNSRNRRYSPKKL